MASKTSSRAGHTKQKRSAPQQQKQYVVAANWKMHPATREKAKQLFADSKAEAKKHPHIHTMLCPPAIYLPEALKQSRSQHITVGAQDAHWEKVGSHTGQVSAAQLADLGAECVILGHSERRAQGETSEAVAKKAKAVLSARMTPIICVGEDDRDEDGDYVNALRDELRKSIEGLEKKHIKRSYIAYEPRWKIGERAEEPLAPEQLHTTSLILKKELAERYDVKTGELARVLYGGSAGPDNAAELISEGQVDGLLVGSASLQAKSFRELLNAVATLQ